ncbi:MAG TPA: YlxR family protein [Candidatus Limnocylindria bacterium]|nr:YlxR family protein [Candidatus Limnocylindria bacterium]
MTLERRAVPTRSCVVCRTSREKRDLLRVVRTPDGVVHFDPTGRASGRGAYVCRDETCINGASGKGTLARALVSSLPTDITETLLTAARGGGTDGP